MSRGRTYTAEEKAQAVAMGAAIGPMRAADQLGFPRRTVASWMHKPAAVQIIADVERSIAEQLRDAHREALAEVRAGLKNPKARLADKAAALRILGEQLALAEGRSTSNVALQAHVDGGDVDDLTPTERAEYRAFLDQVIGEYEAEHPGEIGEAS